MSKKNTRNVQGYMVAEEDILSLLVPELPENHKILGVQWKAEYLGFLFAVESDEYAPVDSGVQIPVEHKSLNRYKGEQ